MLVAVASDGAGSATRSQDGARLICELLLDEVRELLSSGAGVDEITRDFAEAWLLRFQHEVGLRAEVEGLTPRDFACTLLGAIVANDQAIFLQIGDGAIILCSSTGFAWAFWPERGEYENTTFFATDANARDHLQYQLQNSWPVEEVAILTDGLQRLALDLKAHDVFVPFIDPMLAPVRTGDEGYNASLSTALGSYLNSAQVNSRTDDDKTLILATRRGTDVSVFNVPANGQGDE